MERDAEIASLKARIAAMDQPMLPIGERFRERKGAGALNRPV